MARPRSTPTSQAEAKPATSEARSTLNMVLDEELPEHEMRAIIRALRDKAKDGDVTAGRLLEKYMSQGKGTPKQQTSPEFDARLRMVRAREELELLSDEDLLAIVTAGDAA